MVILFLNPGERELFDILPTKWNVIWFDNLYMVVQLLRSFRWQGQQINYVVWFFFVGLMYYQLNLLQQIYKIINLLLSVLILTLKQ